MVILFFNGLVKNKAKHFIFKYTLINLIQSSGNPAIIINRSSSGPR